MAWRIEDAVAHGEIDNTVEGHTTGRVWLAGRDEPLILSLDGDCWRDLAGTRLHFENPQPIPEPDSAALDIDQAGIVGDMTASRKNKVFAASEDLSEELAYEWRNTLYLEWFSEINGRVVIESSAYILTISPHEWQMDEDAEDAQKLANLNSMRDFMALIIRRRDPEGPEPQVSGEVDEYEWEERLKESDRLTNAYQEVLEKYMEDVDSEQKEAFVMGWDGLLDALADRDESEDGEFTSESSDYDLADDDDDDDDDDEFEEDDESEDDDDDDDDNHPLQIKSRDLVIDAMDVVDRDAGPGTHAYELITLLAEVTSKLGGVLGDGDRGYEPEAGFILAVLKRCLNWLNESVGPCQKLLEATQDPEQRAALTRIRSAIFEVRDGVVELRRALK